MEKKQMRLDEFMEVYGVSRKYAYKAIRRAEDPLPAYKQGKCWYVDVEAYLKWRVREHNRCFKYAEWQNRPEESLQAK